MGFGGSVIARERTEYKRSRFEVRVPLWVAIFYLFNRNTLNNIEHCLSVLQMASTVYERDNCFGDHGTKEMLGVWLVSNFAQRLPPTCNSVCKRTQHVTSNNVASFCTGLRLTYIKYAVNVTQKRLAGIVGLSVRKGFGLQDVGRVRQQYGR